MTAATREAAAAWGESLLLPIGAFVVALLLIDCRLPLPSGPSTRRLILMNSIVNRIAPASTR